MNHLLKAMGYGLVSLAVVLFLFDFLEDNKSRILILGLLLIVIGFVLERFR